mmetsp:Transcript_22467/g.55597  ORF Transcript_22467/g.55597 Transcript_22467/m.55597 type:complete len:215 (-) Transcript_22467:1920-2564(-)
MECTHVREFERRQKFEDTVSSYVCTAIRAHIAHDARRRRTQEHEVCSCSHPLPSIDVSMVAWRTHTLLRPTKPRFVPRTLHTARTPRPQTRSPGGYIGDAPTQPGGAYTATVLGQLAFTHVLNLAHAATYPCSCSESEITSLPCTKIACMPRSISPEAPTGAASTALAYSTFSSCTTASVSLDIPETHESWLSGLPVRSSTILRKPGSPDPCSQ